MFTKDVYWETIIYSYNFIFYNSIFLYYEAVKVISKLVNPESFMSAGDIAYLYFFPIIKVKSFRSYLKKLNPCLALTSRRGNSGIVNINNLAVQRHFLKVRFSTFHNKLLNSYFITGFTDAEGSFSIQVCRNPESKISWSVQAKFLITLHSDDLALLEAIKFYFKGVGNINKHGKNSVQYKVTSKQDLTNVILPHFEKYPLITQKRADFELFKKVVDLINQKKHLTTEGLYEIVAIKASINLGLSEELNSAFPGIVPIGRPLTKGLAKIDPNWIAGFASGDGSFIIFIYNTLTKLGKTVRLEFQITQHIRDEELMNSLVEYFGVGNIFKDREVINFRVTKFKDLMNKVIPFFDKYPITGVKSLDFKDFKKVSELMNNKAHLTSEGLEQISLIKMEMNNGRNSKI